VSGTEGGVEEGDRRSRLFLTGAPYAIFPALIIRKGTSSAGAGMECITIQHRRRAIVA